ncbi:Aste57867_24755 [Aphanomyces stellatus]|uniref:Aste57867_24755 protein n=1 Tax=Aphanomyces stellatus TaxID=120398 RepID=A0A485LR95_9STRA|nr:hypothetical protein As57867_024677 [Aphanomyces stellatus]VFU01391.1 Aste57867_24755 [Aphanomyces stellatus]
MHPNKAIHLFALPCYQLPSPVSLVSLRSSRPSPKRNRSNRVCYDDNNSGYIDLHFSDLAHTFTSVRTFDAPPVRISTLSATTLAANRPPTRATTAPSAAAHSAAVPSCNEDLIRHTKFCYF